MQLPHPVVDSGWWVKGGVFVDASLTGGATLSATQDDCTDELVWSGDGFARAAPGLSVQVPGGDLLDANISGSLGANCPITVENNRLVSRLGHNGLIVTIELEFLDGAGSIALNIVLIQPGGDAPVSFGLPALN